MINLSSPEQCGRDVRVCASESSQAVLKLEVADPGAPFPLAFAKTAFDIVIFTNPDRERHGRIQRFKLRIRT